MHILVRDTRERDSGQRQILTGPLELENISALQLGRWVPAMLFGLYARVLSQILYWAGRRSSALLYSGALLAVFLQLSNARLQMPSNKKPYKDCCCSFSFDLLAVSRRFDEGMCFFWESKLTVCDWHDLILVCHFC